MKRNIILAIVASSSIVVSGISGTQAGRQDSIFGTRVSRGQPPADTSTPPRQIDGVTTVRDGLYRISYSRPLEQAAKLLERKLGVPIWYEDAQWVYDGDLVEAANLSGNRDLALRNPGWRGPVVPRGGILDVTLPADVARLKTTNPATLIKGLIASYNSSGNPGQFKLVSFGENEFSIAATQAAGKDGRPVGQTNPLDRVISFPQMERTLADTLQLICDRVGVQLMVQFSGGPEKSRRVTIGANNETAREVLARTMRSPGAMKVAWVLTYMPDLQRYLIGARPAQIEVSNGTSTQRTQLQTLVWPK